MYIFYKIYLQWVYLTLFFIAHCSTIFASELPEGSLIWNLDHKVVTLFRWCDSPLAIVYGPSVNALFKVGHALKIIPLM
jgi:hypothetical protein